MAHKHPSSMDNFSRALARLPLRDLDRWRFLAEASLALGSALEVEEAVATALRMAVPRLADVSVIWLLRADDAAPVRFVHARHYRRRDLALAREFALRVATASVRSSMRHIAPPGACGAWFRTRWTSPPRKRVACGSRRVTSPRRGCSATWWRSIACGH